MKKVICLGHQGDICIFEVDSFPKGERVENAQTKNAILAYGELSGHAHQFENVSDVDVFALNEKMFSGLLFVKPKRPATLVHGRARDFEGKEADHDYHKPVILSPEKNYVIGIVQETDWLTKTIRRVVD